MKQAMLERAVLASVIMGEALPSSLDLEEQHFGDPLCRQLFGVLMKMEKHHQQIDLPSVCMADETLDAYEVCELAKESCVSVVLVNQHCEHLRNIAQRRKMSALLARVQSALEAGADVLEQADAIRKELDTLMSRSMTQTQEGTDMLQLIIHLLGDIESPDGSDDQAKAIATGVAGIDDCLCGGFRPGDLGVIAALTGVGKSAMLAFMMRNAAEQGKRILLVSCEMSDVQNAERFMASISGIPLEQIMRRETLNAAQNIALSDGMERFHPENIRVISSGTETVASVRRAAQRMQMSIGLDLVIVDYLQRLRPERNAGNKAEDVGAIAAGLKSLAVDLNVPVLTAAQFNREAARARSEALGNADAGVPSLHQLRDSSQIEDEANTVIILDEPRREIGTKKRRINAYVAKNRSGMLGAVHMIFDAQTMRYVQAPSGTQAG